MRMIFLCRQHVIIHARWFDDRVYQLDEVLLHLSNHNVQVHIEETFRVAKYFDYVVHIITPDGIKHQEKRSNASSTLNNQVVFASHADSQALHNIFVTFFAVEVISSIL